MSLKLRWLNRKEITKETEPGFALRKGFGSPDVVVKSDEDDNRVIRFIISTNAVDRDDDTIDPNGWDLSNYMKNPVVLFAHNNGQPPVGKGENLAIEDSKLLSDVRFMPRDMNEFSYSLGKMYAGKFMRATSVGFLGKEFKFNEDRNYGIDFLKQELLEFSLVPVPSNPEALMAAKSSGINTLPLKAWAESILDGEGSEIWLPRNVLERMAKDADPKNTFTIYLRNEAGQFTDCYNLKGEKLNIKSAPLIDDVAAVVKEREITADDGANIKEVIQNLAGEVKEVLSEVKKDIEELKEKVFKGETVESEDDDDDDDDDHEAGFSREFVEDIVKEAVSGLSPLLTGKLP